MRRCAAALLALLLAGCASAGGPVPAAGEPGSFSAHLNGRTQFFGGISSGH
jgi:hypothetical protein